MAWTTPPTLTDGQVLTGAHTQIWRDDLLETAPAKFTAAGQMFISTAANAGAARTPSAATVATAETTGSTSYTGLTTLGPQVASLTTGTQALALWEVQMGNGTGGQNNFASVTVSGASSVAAADTFSLRYQSYGNNARHRGTCAHLFSGATALTAGSNTFTVQYRVDGGTGSFLDRNLIVFPL